MRILSKFFSSNSIPAKLSPLLRPTQSFHASRFSTHRKSRHRKPPRKTPPSRDSRPKPSPPSLLTRITEIVGTEPSPSDSSPYEIPTSEVPHFATPKPEIGRPPACQIAQESLCLANADLEDVSPFVHRITMIVRSDNPAVRMEQRLVELDISLSSEIVEKVLNRCFKVGHLALRFFNWVKVRHGYCHTTETYNAMIYIAGEAREFELVEKLVGEMDKELCPKNLKTWTILIYHYGKAKQIGKALDTFEKMRKSGYEPDSKVYEAILRGLFNVGKPDLAMEFYKEMLFKNMEVGKDLYKMVMNCFASSGDMAAVRLVGDDMMKIAKIPDHEVYTCMVMSFCISGNVDEGLELYEEMKKKNLFVDSNVYEVLVYGLCRSSRTGEAIDFVNRIKEISTVDSKVYGCLIRGFLRRGDAPKALELLHEMRELGCQPLVSAYTQAIYHLSRSDDYKKASELFEEMLENGIKPDIVAITCMTAAHVRHNHISEAWKVFQRMEKEGIKPTRKAYSVFIKELCKASKPDDAFKLLNEMFASNINATDDLFRLIISSLKRTGDLEKARIVEKISGSFKLNSSLEAEEVYQSPDNWSLSEENEVSNCATSHDVDSTRIPYSEEDLGEVCRILSSSTDWSSVQKKLDKCTIHFTPELVAAVLNSCQRHGCAALQFFSWVRKQDGYRHTAETYNMAIKMSGSAKDFKLMRTLYREMRGSGCTVTPNTWTIMIAQYGQAGLTQMALDTFKEMKTEGYEPNNSAFKYLIVFLCGKKGRKMDEAIKIFQEMMHARFMPDKEMVEIYLTSLCESGKLLEAKRCVKSLIERGFTKQLAYTFLVKALCRGGEAEEALVLADDMERLGCIRDQFIYGSLVHALLRGGQFNEALDKIDEMKRLGIPQSVHIHTSLIVHFCKEKQIEKAVEIFRKMREDGCEPTIVTYSALIRGYMNMGLVSEAWNVFHRMKIKGPFPDFHTYSMFMTCLCKAGMSGDGLKLIHEMLEAGITPSAINFRTVFHGLNREGI